MCPGNRYCLCDVGLKSTGGTGVTPRRESVKQSRSQVLGTDWIWSDYGAHYSGAGMECDSYNEWHCTKASVEQLSRALSSLCKKQEPVITVVASESARAMCKQYGLLAKELLMPFRHLRGINIPVRTTGESSNRIDQISLRFLDPAEMLPLSTSEAEERVKVVTSEVLFFI